MNNPRGAFGGFTNLYSLSKTLRFELKPYLEIPEGEKGKLFGDDKEYYKNCKTYTEYYLKKANKEYYDNEKVKNTDLQLVNFLHDERIEDAYQVLKPVFDTLHEEFITDSLESAEAKKIDFGNYYGLYEKQKSEQNKDEKKKIDKPLETERGKLRKAFTPIYEAEGKNLKNKAGKEKKDKDILKESGFKVLIEAGILKYIKNNIDEFADKKLKNNEGKEITKKDIETALGAENIEGIFDGFFTYFSGFNQNRENYYSTEEKATAVASRIVDENLSKFCDNILLYRKNENDYLKIFNFLKNKGKDLKLKNSKFGKENEPEFIPAYDMKNDEKSFSVADFVNCLSQGEIEKYNAKIANANYLINLYNQNKDGNSSKLSMFKILYKQIGCGEKKDFIKTIKDNAELKQILEKACEAGKKYFIRGKSEDGGVSNIFDFTDYIQSHENYKGVYWSDKAINTISGKYFANWDTLKNKLGDAKVFNKNTGEDKADVKYKVPQAVMLSELFAVLDDNAGEDWREKGIFFKASLFEGDQNKSEIIKNANRPSQALLKMICDDMESLAKNFIDSGDKILKISDRDYQKDENKQKIKNWLDNALWINQILKYFKVKANKIKGDSIDARIDSGLDMLVFSSDNPAEDYDMIRNYLTQKPQDEINKLKLNFENSSLAGGWDENKEKDNSCIILKDEQDKQYLAVMKYENTKVFEQKNSQLYIADNAAWKKMIYKLVPGASKTLPKVFFSKKWTANRPTPSDIVEIYQKGSFKKENVDFNDKKEKDESRKEKNREKIIAELQKTCWMDIRYNIDGKIESAKYVNKEKLAKLIDFYKENLKKYPSEEESWDRLFAFGFSDTKSYKSIDQFYIEVDKQGYKLEFVTINKARLDEYVRDGKIYLFEIRSRDNNLVNGEEKTSAKNLQTIYWNAAFGGDDNKPKLNGEAEIFYRPAIAENKLNKKKDKNGKEIIDGYRFSKEKFIFHCPITLNFCLKETKINDKLNAALAKPENGQGVYFLGIDRGEKHLAYYSLVNQKGEILEQGTLNLPFLDKNGKSRSIKVEKKSFEKDSNGGIIKDKDGNDKIKIEFVECWNYNDLLDARAGDRDYARKNWTTIGTIKELKDGYISQVVRKIVDLSIYKNTETKEFREMPAFIVLEDLNIGFKRGRQKIEKQVYQKLELALAKKLNFLVDKKADIGEIGSVTKAIQLTPPVNNFGDMENRKQFGNMLYIRADYTSQTDPATGWRKSIYLKSGSESNVKEQIEKSFFDIRYESGDYCFEYRDRHGKMWQLYSSKNGVSLDRFHGERNNSKNVWESEKQPLNEMLDILFDEKRFDKSKSLYEQMFKGGVALTRLPKEINKKDKPAWESLRFVIILIQQIRNTGKNGDDRNGDFIQSPVRDEKTGEHFDSRIYLDKEQKGEKADLPTSGDANGAYNIARKGIVVAEHIKRGFDKLYISDEEWDTWLAGDEIWDKWLKENRESLTKTRK